MLDTELTQRGDDVDYQKVPGVNHAGIPLAAEEAAMAFFQQRLPSH
jgi:hypothetical protein